MLQTINFMLKNESLKLRLLHLCLKSYISVIFNCFSFSMNQMQQEKELTENILKVVSRGSVRS